MRKIEAYELDNGEIIKDKAAAEYRETQLKIKKAVKSLCEELMYERIGVSNIVDTLVEHKDEFVKALSGHMTILD